MTDGGWCLTPTLKGLSPPTRGNRYLGLSSLDGSRYRSIPAHAGEPLASNPSRTWPLFKVYPRPRGGTYAITTPSGMSLLRSIPAHAGEPPTRSNQRHNQPDWVYPRPRGGTVHLRHASPPLATFGLSPPTRGNPDYPVGS